MALNPKRLQVRLVRDGFNQPWGFRLAGGADLGLPLTVQRVPDTLEPTPKTLETRRQIFKRRNYFHLRF